VAGEFRIGFQDAVCGGVVSCCVHGIGACLVEGGREPHIAGVPAGDGDFWHGGGKFSCSWVKCVVKSSRSQQASQLKIKIQEQVKERMRDDLRERRKGNGNYIHSSGQSWIASGYFGGPDDRGARRGEVL
jgi:hypothetical protein